MQKRGNNIVSLFIIYDLNEPFYVELYVSDESNVTEVTKVQRHVTESSPKSDHTKITRLTIRKRKLQIGGTCVGGGTSTSNEVQQLAERRTKKKSEVLVSKQVENESSGTHNVGVPVVEETPIIRLRTTPYPLFTAMKNLSDKQEKCVQHMGFGGLIVKCDIPRVIRQRPVVKAWPLDKLQIQEAEELANGGFGLGDFAEPYVGNVGCVDGPGASLQGMTPKNDIQYPKASEITEWRRKHFVLFGIDVNSIEGQPQPGDEPNDGAEQVILGSDGKVDENREFETPTQFFQHPDVISAVDVAIWEEMSRKKGTTSLALPLDSIPSFSLGLTQEFEENWATNSNMHVHVPEMHISGNNKGRNIIMYDKGKGTFVRTLLTDPPICRLRLKTRVRASLLSIMKR
ncbi:hypothetical protein L6452_08488 [Arctium lappa]|uniref:Uncharacterized protein n=1 Tax=Arctium lappa TaxID=4217 RepID=A0ACB9DHF0_ARCLA|nr:hypothetical protein L6452_08488 [Arctium lappa]